MFGGAFPLLGIFRTCICFTILRWSIPSDDTNEKAQKRGGVDDDFLINLRQYRYRDDLYGKKGLYNCLEIALVSYFQYIMSRIGIPTGHIQEFYPLPIFPILYQCRFHCLLASSPSKLLGIPRFTESEIDFFVICTSMWDRRTFGFRHITIKCCQSSDLPLSCVHLQFVETTFSFSWI